MSQRRALARFTPGSRRSMLSAVVVGAVVGNVSVDLQVDALPAFPGDRPAAVVTFEELGQPAGMRPSPERPVDRRGGMEEPSPPRFRRFEGRRLPSAVRGDPQVTVLGPPLPGA